MQGQYTRIEQDEERDPWIDISTYLVNILNSRGGKKVGDATVMT